MKTALVLFSNELNLAESLFVQMRDALPACTLSLRVLGAAAASDREKIACFEKITEIVFNRPENLNDPACCARALCACLKQEGAELVVFSAGTRGDELAARLSAELELPCVLSVREIFESEGGLCVKKPVYAGNLMAAFKLKTLPALVSLSPARAERMPEKAEKQVLSRFEAQQEDSAWLKECVLTQNAGGNPFTDAGLVFAAGRGAVQAETLETLSTLARETGGVLGGTRPVVFDGKLPRAKMLGASAEVISPDCCVVFGASGAAPFMAGVEKSARLIAVNRDPGACVFQQCDFGVVDDCGAFAQALLTEIEHRKTAEANKHES